MRKTLTYSTFIIASLLVVIIFVTSKTYTQLALAALLYPIPAFFALKIFSRKDWKAASVTIHVPEKETGEEIKQEAVEVARPKTEKVDILDIDKRTFLKFIGATGLSIFIFSFLGQRVESLLFGRTLQPGLGALQSTPGTGIVSNQSTLTDGYRIAEIDDGAITYYGFTNMDGAWLVMKEDTDSNSFRYVKGDSNFPGNWSKRISLKYDYNYKV